MKNIAKTRECIFRIEAFNEVVLIYPIQYFSSQIWREDDCIICNVESKWTQISKLLQIAQENIVISYLFLIVLCVG